MNPRRMSEAQLRNIPSQAQAEEELRRREQKRMKEKQRNKAKAQAARRKEWLRGRSEADLRWLAGNPWPLEGKTPQVQVPWNLGFNRRTLPDMAQKELQNRQEAQERQLRAEAKRNQVRARQTVNIAGQQIPLSVLAVAGLVLGGLAVAGGVSGGASDFDSSSREAFMSDCLSEHDGDMSRCAQLWQEA